MKKRDLILKIVLPLLTVCTVAFIFSNSLSPGDRSQSSSDVFSETLRRIFYALFGRDGFAAGLDYSHIIRKTAHLIEFALLGFLSSASVSVYGCDRPITVIASSFFGLLCAVCDEFIQSFVPERSSELKDVIVDFAGVTAGILVLLLVGFIAVKIKERRRAADRRQQK